jgi:hypothetical protein
MRQIIMLQSRSPWVLDIPSPMLGNGAQDLKDVCCAVSMTGRPVEKPKDDEK